MQESQLVIHDDEVIVPFWNRIPRFFVFPMQTMMLLVLVPLSLASLLATLVPVPNPFDYLITEGVIWLIALRHAFGVMDRTSKGLLSPDQYDRSPDDPDRVNLPWKMLGVMIAWSFIIGMLASISKTLGLVANLFFMLAFPASIMTLTVANSFWQAVNPAHWISIMRLVGKAYLALFVFLLLLSGGALIVLPLMGPFLRSWLGLPLINFAFLYFNLIMFNMMGYVLYQYHHILGVPVTVDFAEANGKNRPKSDQAGEEIARKVADGDLAGALDAAYEQQRLEPENIAVQDRYNKLLVLAGKNDRALDHGRRYLATLMRINRSDRAVDLLKRMRELDEHFMIEEPDHVLPLAKAARRCHEYPLALMTMRSFDKRHPRHPDVPEIYFLSAQIFCENLHKDDLAASLLKELRAKFPDHPMASQAEAYLQTLERLRHGSTEAC